jgi:peptidoglycan/xylan/chitin deacetylase (PgdA/CDA1 family)
MILFDRQVDNGSSQTMKTILKLTAANVCVVLGALLWLGLHSGCNAETQARIPQASLVNSLVKDPVAPAAPVVADAATILERRQVPILCYHQVREWKASDSKTARAYIVPDAIFRDQMKALADSGYQAILPDQLYDWLAFGKPLPQKPIMITFDDTRIDQFTAAMPELNRHGFKGVFFIMTVALGKPGYMSKEQVKQLADQGHVIGSHTYDHKNVKTYTGVDWEEQVAKPSKQLQSITGKPVEYFAYPFGLWNKEAIPNLRRHDFKAAFQLATERDAADPLYTIRRIIVTGDRGGEGLLRQIRSSFR